MLKSRLVERLAGIEKDVLGLLAIIDHLHDTGGISPDILLSIDTWIRDAWKCRSASFAAVLLIDETSA